jgi:hypothetical protein
VLDIVLEFLAYLGIRVLKKKKGEDTESTSVDAVIGNQDLDNSERGIQEGVAVCAECSCAVEKDAIYELGKAWCRDCYKRHVLKVNE